MTRGRSFLAVAVAAMMFGTSVLCAQQTIVASGSGLMPGYTRFAVQPDAPALIAPIWASSAHQPPSLSNRPRIRTRKTMGAIFGAIGGFYAGGAVGFALDRHNCRGDDCGLAGAVVGAPVGAVAGGIFGSWLATR